MRRTVSGFSGDCLKLYFVMEETLFEETSLMNTPGKSEEKLLIEQFSLAKDEKYFKDLVVPHLEWLKRLMASVFHGNENDMEDALQEILISFYSDCIKFKDKSGFKTFFYSYARHKAIDYLRKIHRYNKHHDHFGIDENIEYKNNPESDFIETELRQEIAKSLSLLEPEDRLLLTMKDCEEFTIEEIADITGINPGTIKSRLHRLREKLAKYLEGRIQL